jgi:hypothetical protein
MFSGDTEPRPQAQKVPRVALALVLAGLLVWGAGALYTLFANPEILFFKHAAALKQSWAARVTSEHGTKTVFCGGSSCTFAVNPDRMLSEHALPAANMGLGAGMGLPVLTRFALKHVRAGDTLVLAMEPPVLLGPMEDTMLGVQTSFALGHPEWLASHAAVDRTEGAPWVSALLMLRPGGYHAFTLLGKLLGGKPLYRYQQEEIQPSGWQRSPLRRPLEPYAGDPASMSREVRSFLVSLREWCEARQVRIAYALPWTFTDAEREVELQRNNLHFLQQMAGILPVLKDPRLGADTEKEHFADTIWHLTEPATNLRTDVLARQINGWELWSLDELRAAAANASSRFSSTSAPAAARSQP